METKDELEMFDELVSGSKYELNKIKIFRSEPADEYTSSMMPVPIQWINIASEFSEEHSFLIDIDSLLLKLFSDENLSWANGGEFGHLVYLLEKFAHVFVERRVSFQFVEFEDQRDMWPPSLYFARYAVLSHLKFNLKFYVARFRDVSSKEFLRFVRDEEPTFMMVAFGDFFESLKCTDEIDLIQLILKKLRISCLCEDLNIALIDEIEIGLSSIHAFYANSSSKLSSTQCFTLPEANYNLRESLLGFCVISEFIDKCLRSTKVAREVVAVSAVAFCFNNSKSFENSNEEVLAFCKMLMMYLAVHRNVSLRLRALPFMEQNVWETEHYTSLEIFLQDIWRNAGLVLQVLREDDMKDIDFDSMADLWDGNLFAFVLENANEKNLGQQIKKGYEELLTLLGELTGVDFGPVPELQGRPKLPWKRQKGLEENLQVVGPLNIELWEKYVGKTSFPTEPSSCKFAQVDGKYGSEPFDEEYHWHARRLLDSKEEKDPRSTQFYLRYLRGYGESLEGPFAYKKSLFATDFSTQTKSKGKDMVKMKSGASKKTTESKKEKIIRENLEKKKLENERGEADKWKTIRKIAEDEAKRGKTREALQRIANFECCSEEIRKSSLLFKSELVYQLLYEESRRTNPEKLEKLALDLFLNVRELLSVEQVDKEAQGKIRFYLEVLGLRTLAESLQLPVTIRGMGSEKEIAVRLHGTEETCAARFQLLITGPELKRGNAEPEDPRVANFVPDKWQRDLFDNIDANRSVLIVAPTSSGKTYAAYYCMERVLHDSLEDVVVYVSPTKALVNQVTATVYAKFNCYQEKQKEGISIIGTFTRDFRNNETSCRILITVPQCLEILLLSPSQRKWIQKIRYVICDEVHCMGDEYDLGGSAWENILLAINCPFIALSATIQDPQQLKQWLQNAEDFKKTRDVESGTLRTCKVPGKDPYEVQLIEHSEKYADLNKFVFFSEPKAELVPLNPIACLTTKILVDEECSRLSKITLSPKEAVHLYDAMDSQGSSEVKHLDPGNFFPQKFLERKEVLKYGTALQDELKQWAISSETDSARDVIHHLGQEVTSRFQNSSTDVTGKQFILKNFVQLVELLKQEDKLPVIVFVFDRSLCEKLVQKLVDRLEQGEKNCAEYRNLVKTREAEKQMEEKRLKKDRDAMEESVRKRKYRNYLLEDPPLAKYSYAGQGIIAEDDKEMKRFVYQAVGGSEEDDLYLRALRRGISWHHAGLRTKRRGLTEMLFRKKFVRVVVATSTLALGINMPCRTVVFGHDAVHLTAQQFQQMSGRAGRRGFDKEGNVVFCSLSQRKIARIITGSLPRMIGHMPVGNVKVLRLLLLTASKHENQECSRSALNSALSMLSCPLLSFARSQMEPKLKLHFSFILQYLLQEGLINQEGRLIGLAGLVTHLHYHEPYNLVLASFLQRGLFHELCKEYSGEERNEIIVIVLSYLFAPYPLHRSVLERLKKRKDRNLNSRILLPPVPENFVKGAMEFNLRAWKIFHAFIRSVADVDQWRQEVSPGSAAVLPVSKISFARNQDQGFIAEGTLEQFLKDCSSKGKACSPFAALSGNDDSKLLSLDSPFSNIHHGLYMDMDFIPFVNVDIRLNGYAWDFYNHGIWQSIVEENGLQESYVYQLLKDFLLVLKSIVTSLWEIGEIQKKKGNFDGEPDIVLEAMKEVLKEFEERFNKAYEC